MFIPFVRVNIYYYFFIGVKFLKIELKWTYKLNWIVLNSYQVLQLNAVMYGVTRIDFVPT